MDLSEPGLLGRSTIHPYPPLFPASLRALDQDLPTAACGPPLSVNSFIGLAKAIHLHMIFDRIKHLQERHGLQSLQCLQVYLGDADSVPNHHIKMSYMNFLVSYYI